MKYIGIFLTVLFLGVLALMVLKPGIAGAAGGQYISRGDAVDFATHLPDDPDQLVLFQFTAKWCGACQMVEPYAADLSNSYDFLQRKKIDIVSWESDAAQQMFEQFGSRGIPYFALYNSEGEALALGDYQRIERAVMRFAEK